MTVLNLSFAACFLGVYHLGAVGALLHHGDKLLGSLRAILCREGIEEYLPSEAHCLAIDRLDVSVTHFESWKNYIVSSFTSGGALLQVLLASSFVPVYAGFKAVEFRGQSLLLDMKWMTGSLHRFWFGGFTDSLPILPIGQAITVSPFAGLQDVCPVHRGHFNTQLRLANMNITFSMDNIKHLNQAQFPPSTSNMQSLREGFDDAVRFLKRETWMS
ncbi:patatin-like phospholipase domain-containing protein 4 [Siniperca chuatsi]|uniref:patatin-like phospholipase domain-containing protein 4 n=1 Tax=Siniperca chuatsi TaxID=119488 RepID=UPI001CE14A8E|nr:patatin-like phospholipase domain-containing protein 4 [Siniperca chuatsi]